jgi:hypothetical protein
VARTAAGFLAEGLTIGQPAVVVASAGRCAAIAQRLSALGLPEELPQTGQLHLFDRTKTLSSLMVHGTVDAERLSRAANAMIQRALNGRKSGTIRAYGEIADLLWERGHAEAAIRLEAVWNELAKLYDIAVLCGYAVDRFYKPSQLRIQSVCDQHTHVIPFPKPLTA